MSLTSIQLTEIVKATVVMFSAAPGGYMSGFSDSYLANGSDITKFMTALSQSAAFTNQYPSSMSNTQKAVKMSAAYGLTDTTTAGSAGKHAYDYFLNGLTANKNMGVMFAEANAFLATTTDAAFATTKTLLANKTAVAEYYTVALGSTSTDLTVLTSSISAVTATTDVSSNAAMEASIRIPAALTSDIVKATVVMFSAAPGGYMSGLTNSFIANGSDMTKFMTALSQSSAFTNQYPSSMSNTQKAVKMAAAYGLTDTTTAGSAGKHAYDYFLNGLTVNKNMGVMFAEANAFLATTTDAAFATTKTLLANKTTVAEHYTVTLGLTSTDLTVLASSISAVTATTDVSSTAALTIALPATLLSSTPTDNATGFAVGNNIVLTFNETIALGTGDIVLRKTSDGSIIETFNVATGTSNLGGTVSASGTGVTINPNADLAGSTGYYVTVAATAVKDTAGNLYGGINNTYELSFTTGAAVPIPTPPDTTVPTLSSSTPTDNATLVAVGNNIVLTFNEAIALGTGTIVLKKTSDDSIIETFNVATGTGNLGGTVTASGTGVTINPNAGLSASTEYYVTVAATAVKDTANNAYAGILGTAQTVSFTTAANAGNTTALANVAVADILAGGAGDDTFTASYGNGAAGTFDGVLDVLDGSGGTDTLALTIGAFATTSTDSDWTNIDNIEKISFTTTGAGAQTITTGAEFNTSFASLGVAVDLTAANVSSAITIDMGTTAFTGAARITTTSSGAAAHVITTGSGAATVTSTTFAGAQTINGAGLTTVTATSNGAGDQTIGAVSSGNLVTVTATQNGSGHQNITSTSTADVTVTATQGTATAGNQNVTTGAGNDTVTVTSNMANTKVIITNGGNDTILLLATGAAATSNTITAGAGADSITLVTGGLSAPDTIVIATADVGATWATADTIVNFLTTVDSLNLDVAATGVNYTAASEADGAAMANEAAVLTAAQLVLDGTVKYYFAYNINGTGDGVLYYDADGVNGGEDVILLTGAATDNFLILGDIA